MLPSDILSYTRAVPFRPFRLVLNSGKTYEVRHPEMVRVMVSTVLYFHATDPEGPAERLGNRVSLTDSAYRAPGHENAHRLNQGQTPRRDK